MTPNQSTEFQAFLEQFALNQARFEQRMQLLQDQMRLEWEQFLEECRQPITKPFTKKPSTQSTPPHPIKSLQKKKRNQKTRLQYKRRSLQASLQVRQEQEKPSEIQAYTTKNLAQISVESTQCRTKNPRDSGMLSTRCHQESK